MFKYANISKNSSNSYRFDDVILNEDCRWPRKLVFETELYESWIPELEGFPRTL